MRTRTKKPANQEEINLNQGIVIGLFILFILIIHTYALMPHVHPPGSYNEAPTVNNLITAK